jgi:hypothetical protein
MDKLLLALDNCHSTSPGPDSVHNLMLSQLPPRSMEFLLPIYNHIAKKTPSHLPEEAMIIPILTTNNDYSLETSYRPICLISSTSEAYVNR